METKLKKKLIEMGVSQSELAKESGKNVGTVNKICNGSQNPSVTMKNALLHAFNALLREKKLDTTLTIDDVFK